MNGRLIPVMAALALVAGIIFVLSGCPNPAHTPQEQGTMADRGIYDAVHRQGNTHFYFLPPLVPMPVYSGVFDGGLSPRVEIWETHLDQGRIEFVRIIEPPFTMTTGPGSETIRVAPEEQHYIVNWHTKGFGLVAENSYRIRVFVEALELGYADVDVVNSGKELKNVQTGEFIPLLNGRTLPIKFRIEAGALNVVGPWGGTVVSADGKVTLIVPEGALTASIAVGFAPVTVDPSTPGVRTVSGTVYEVGPVGTQFALPATIRIVYDEGQLQQGVEELDQRLLRWNGAEWEEATGGSVDDAANTVSGSVVGLGLFAVGVVPRLKGYVRDGSGAAVGGALIRLYNDSFSDYTGSDGAGYYAFYGVPPGTYFLVAKRDGYTLFSRVINIQ